MDTKSKKKWEREHLVLYIEELRQVSSHLIPSMSTRSHITGNGQVVALKKVKMGNIKDGVSWTAIREIKILREIQHENIIPVR